MGYCGSACLHSYIISPEKAKIIIKNKNKLCNDPIDKFYFYNFCKKGNCYKVPNKYKKNKGLYGSGLIFQDRNKYIGGMHDIKNKRTKLFY